MKYSIAVLAAIVATASAAVLPGACPPKPPTKPDFDATQYIGDWYNALVIPAPFAGQPASMTCSRATYGLNDNGTVSVYNIGTLASGEYDEICGYAYQPDPEGAPGDLLVVFPSIPGPQPTEGGSYWVLDTDYENYAAVYSCGSGLFDQFRVEFGWVLTREQFPSEDVINMALDVFARNGVDTNTFIDVAQSDSCVYEISPSCKDEM